MSDLDKMNLCNLCLYAFSVLVTLFLLIGAATDTERRKEFMKSFILLLISNIVMQLGEAGIWLFDGSLDKAGLLYLSAELSLIFSYVLVACYVRCLTFFIREKTQISSVFVNIITGICAVFILLLLIALPYGWFFSFDGEGHIVYGSLYGLVRLFDVIFAVSEMAVVLRFHKVLTVRGTAFLLSFSVLPLMISVAVQFLWYPAPEYVSITLSLIMIYILFHGETTRQLAEREVQLAGSRIDVMLSQIQPHFLHNTINVIRDLCYENPEQAYDALNDFSVYLRGNIDALSKRTLVHFSSELTHIRAYLKIEKLRFGDRLRVVYDIGAEDFFLPSLTVQPIVENAVKHGISEKEDGGTLTLRTRCEEDSVLIEITDDGVGFDDENIISGDDRRLHIGIENVRSRLRMMAGGTLTIKSAPGLGTEVVIRLKKNREAYAYEHLSDR
ncbi:MAG: sensor histidine kinase [Candidatus Ornithomonoglobus sp.]